jgi:RNA polymerase sigma-70 factor, ECF subfamily
MGLRFGSLKEGLFLEHLHLDELSDIELIGAFQEGNTHALSYLLKRRKTWLYNIAKRAVSDPQIAEDGLQEALVQIWRGAKEFRGESQVTTWMYQIVFRCCIDVVRKENVRKAEALPEDSENLIGSSTGFESQIADKLLIHGALAELEAGHREVLELVWLKELSHEEASERLGVPIGTVKSRTSRAQARLREVIQEILSESGNQRASSSVKESEVTNVRYFRR